MERLLSTTMIIFISSVISSYFAGLKDERSTGVKGDKGGLSDGSHIPGYVAKKDRLYMKIEIEKLKVSGKRPRFNQTTSEIWNRNFYR